MATLDDKLLGEKLHYYCSSSEDEDEGDSDNEDEPTNNQQQQQPISQPPPTISADGSSSNTGPKGVLKDWQQYKKLESEQREIAEVEKMALAQKLSLTCRTAAEDEAAKKKEEKIDEDLQELLDDGFLEAYMQKRMKEMMAKTNPVKRFGSVIELSNGESLLLAIDGEDKECTVIVLVHEPHADGCEAMHGCIRCLAEDYINVKFCRIRASGAGLSKHFESSGVPALLVYRGGQLIGNFIRMTDRLGEDFFANEVEGFLIEHGMLQNKTEVPKIIRGPVTNNSDSDDSD